MVCLANSYAKGVTGVRPELAENEGLALLQAPFSGLTTGLAAVAATPDDALSELATSGQAITVEARTLAHPVSYELASSVKARASRTGPPWRRCPRAAWPT